MDSGTWHDLSSVVLESVFVASPPAVSFRIVSPVKRAFTPLLIIFAPYFFLVPVGGAGTLVSSLLVLVLYFFFRRSSTECIL